MEKTFSLLEQMRGNLQNRRDEMIIRDRVAKAEREMETEYLNMMERYIGWIEEQLKKDVGIDAQENC